MWKDGQWYQGCQVKPILPIPSSFISNYRCTWMFVHTLYCMCWMMHACMCAHYHTAQFIRKSTTSLSLLHKHMQMKYKKSLRVFMCLNKFLWQVAEPATMSESNHNAACQVLQSKTNKRFRDWNGLGVKRKKRKSDINKKQEKTERLYSSYHMYSESWHTALQKVCSTVLTSPSRVQKSWPETLPDKSVILAPQGWNLNGSKLPDISIIRVLWDMSYTGRHRWLKGTSWQVQYTQRGRPKRTWPICQTGHVKMNT